MNIGNISVVTGSSEKVPYPDPHHCYKSSRLLGPIVHSRNKIYLKYIIYPLGPLTFNTLVLTKLFLYICNYRCTVERNVLSIFV